MSTVKVQEPSYKSLRLSMRFQGKELAIGTGFIALSSIGHVLITNRHNVTGRDNETGELLSGFAGIPSEIAIWHNSVNQLGSWVKIIEPLFRNNEPLWYEHPRLGEQADIVALPLINEQLSVANLYPYSFHQQLSLLPLEPTNIVSVVGFPYGLSIGGGFAIWTTGFIASELSIDMPYFLIDCRTREGQSGSPVIIHNTSGIVQTTNGLVVGANVVTELVGIYSGRINKESDIGRVWKIAIIKELIDSLDNKH